MLSGEARLLRPPGPATLPRSSLPATPTPVGPSVDLLALVDPAKDAVKGTWRHQGSALASVERVSSGRIMIPLAPEGSYELQINFVRISGNDLVGVILPVASSTVTLHLGGWLGRASGLRLINGKGDNETVKASTLENGRQYSVNVKVLVDDHEAWITVTLDGEPLIAWRGAPSALSLNTRWRLPLPGYLGLAHSETTVVFRSVRLRMLSGEARLLRPAGK